MRVVEVHERVHERHPGLSEADGSGGVAVTDDPPSSLQS